VLKGLHSARDGEVVGVARGVVFGIGLELSGGVFCFEEESGEAFGGLLFLREEGGFESLRQLAPAYGCRKNRTAFGNARVLGTPGGEKTAEREWGDETEEDLVEKTHAGRSFSKKSGVINEQSWGRQNLPHLSRGGRGFALGKSWHVGCYT
jgi:hypothetical protein